ncbi:MAG: hypothetical protein ACXWMC_08770, partial [Syntrophales bacterium]
MELNKKWALIKLQSMFTEVFGLGRAAILSASLLAIAVIAIGLFLFFYLAPPNTISMTSGPEGSSFEKYAEKYVTILQRQGVT